ncbi:MAG: DNA cytosine methyltransferase [Rhizobiales bacterium]|nr:DNA cytosine methyltransferase [Hyphomicrobiales bacterium]
MNVLDLFSGIGGFSLGLERAGMRTVAFCEIDEFCREVLRKHWPHVPIFGDIIDLRAISIGPVDVICGGFPCQDVSIAGDRAGLAGKRSGLWVEMRRCIRAFRPRFAVVENTTGLLNLGMATVLGDLAALGYSCVWHCIPAAAVGAAHPRDRVWIVAYHCSERRTDGAVDHGEHARQVLSHINRQLALSLERQGEQQSHADPLACFGARIPHGGPERASYVEQALCGKLHGLPDHLDALKALGNSVVPQIPELIGRAIMTANQPQVTK